MHSFCLDPAINSKLSGFRLKDLLKGFATHPSPFSLLLLLRVGLPKYKVAAQGPVFKENVLCKFTLKFIEQTLNLMHGNVEMSYSHNTFLCRFSLY